MVYVVANLQALPIYLDKIFNQIVAIVLSVTFVLFFGEVAWKTWNFAPFLHCSFMLIITLCTNCCCLTGDSASSLYQIWTRYRFQFYLACAYTDDSLLSDCLSYRKG